jgi:hypothetical protein
MASDNQVKVILNAEDKTGPALKSAQTGMSSFVATAGKFAAAAGLAFATKKVFNFGKAVVSAAAEAESSKIRFESIMKNVEGATNETSQALLKAADKATQFGFSNEEAAENMARFFARTKNLNETLKINQAALDLAAAKNISLSEAGTILQQVYSGQARGLRDLGIQLEDGVTGIEAIEATWNNFAGTAEARSGTLQGKMAILNESWGEMKEVLGTALLDGLKPFIDEMTAFISKPENIEFFKQMFEAIGTLIEYGFKALKFIIAGVQEEIRLLSEVFLFLINFWNEKLVPAGQAIASIFDSIKTAINNTIDATSRLVSKLAEVAMSPFLGAKALGTNIGNFISGARAMGGPVSGGSSYLVGEQGPEIFTPFMSGRIIPNGGNGTVINISMSSPQFLDRNAAEMFSNQLLKVLKENLRI